MTNEEVSKITTSGLTIGSSTLGSIFVNGLTDATTDSQQRISLIATKPGDTLVKFLANPTIFDKGITVDGAGGIHFSDSVTTKSSTTYLYANSGTLTVADTRILSTAGQLLEVTSDDMDLAGAF